MVVVVGEILFDMFGAERRLGGAPFNYAYHLQQLGIPVRFITRVGDDALGREILDYLSAVRFNLDDVQIDSSRPTGTVRVDVEDAGSPNFEIMADVAYDYVRFLPDRHRPLIGNADIVYFGTLIQRSASGFQTVQQMLNEMPAAAKGFYDVNLRPDSYRDEVVIQSLDRTQVLKISDSEWGVVKKMLEFDGGDDEFAHHLLNAYPIETIALTQGSAGSRLISRAGDRSTAPVPVEHFVDAVGAGDAYAAMLTAGLLYEWPAERILEQSARFAAGICEIKGAIPDDASFYDSHRVFSSNGGKHVE